MPVSRKRTKPKPPPKRRNKTRDAQARETQTAQQKAASVKKLSPAAFMRRRILGWSLVGLAVLVGVSHLVEHLGFFSFASQGVEDLLAGYPMAFLLGIIGVIILSK
jgi:hypothetical protein